MGKNALRINIPLVWGVNDFKVIHGYLKEALAITY